MHDSIEVQAKMQLECYLNFTSLGCQVSCNVQESYICIVKTHFG